MQTTTTTSTRNLGRLSPIVFTQPLNSKSHFGERPSAKPRRRVRFSVTDSQITDTTPSLISSSPSVEMMSYYDRPLVGSGWGPRRPLADSPGAESLDPLRSPCQVLSDSDSELEGFQPDSRRPRRPCFLGRCFLSFLARDVESLPARRDIDTAWYPPTNRRRDAYFSTDYQAIQSGKYRDFFGNDLLLRRSVSGKELRWNVVKDPSTAIIPYGSDLFSYIKWNRPALGLTVSTAYIHFKESRLWRLERVFGPIFARSSVPNQPITFHHLLNAIYTYFTHAVSYKQMASLGLAADEVYQLEATRLQRLQDLRRTKGRQYDSYDGGKCVESLEIQRADFLYGFCGFKKLCLSANMDRQSHLFLSLQ